MVLFKHNHIYHIFYYLFSDKSLIICLKNTNAFFLIFFNRTTTKKIHVSLALFAKDSTYQANTFSTFKKLLVILWKRMLESFSTFWLERM